MTQKTSNTTVKKQELPKIQEWPGAFGIYKYSKHTVAQNLNTILVILLISLGINIFGSVLGGNDMNSLQYIISSLIVSLLSVVISIALIVVYIAGLKNEKVSISEALQGISTYIVNYIVASILIGIASLVSFILFVIPAFFVIPRLVFAPYLVIDKKMDALDAVKASWDMSKGHVAKIYGITGATIAMALLSLTIIGIPFSIYFLIMYSAALAVLYGYISNKK
jgi:hypothetical protein